MKSLVLIGAPGSGKSTIGRVLAAKAHVPFIDTDQLIEKQAGESISGIFVDKGEAYFRSLEREQVGQSLREALRVPVILSLGGGSVLDPETQQELGQHEVAWLQVNIAEALKRVGMNQSRPLLLGNVRANMINMLQERTPIYQSLANVTIDTSGRSPEECAQELLTFLKEQRD